MVSSSPRFVTLYPSRLYGWRTDQLSLFSLFTPLLEYFEVRRSAWQSATRPSLRDPLLARLLLVLLSLYLPLPCLCPDTVWLVLWLVTVLQGPCQMFVLRESAGLALFRSLTVPLLDSVPSCCCCFTLRCPLKNFLGLAVLADASTAFAIVSLRLFSFGHNWHYSPPGSLANSQHSCQIIATFPLHATPVDRSLVMRAFGGAITSPCSNDSECRRITPAIFGLYPFLLLFCWLVVYLNKLPKRHSLGDC